MIVVMVVRSQAEHNAFLDLENVADVDLYHVRVISCDSHSHCTPPPAPPRLRGGETKHSFGGVGFLGFSK
ncbi:hypothetical protein [Nostoc sp.]|uniref:hypothetical protein n=1 Tax=Nostoc sp. TaxID=1180 RepID=UPI002FF72CF0